MSDRSCYTREGLPKRRFETRAAAKAHLRGVAAKVGDHYNPSLQPYRCPTCGWFHVGAYPKTDGTRERLRSRHGHHHHHALA